VWGCAQEERELLARHLKPIRPESGCEYWGMFLRDALTQNFGLWKVNLLRSSRPAGTVILLPSSGTTM